MRSLLLIIAILLSFGSCLQRGNRLKHEYGSVVAKQYQGEISAYGTGVGVSSNGNVIVTSHSVYESAKFNVVFKCQHGVIFTVNDPEVYAKVKESDTVVIDYYEMLDRKGKVQGFDFIDANKCVNPQF